MYALCKPPPCQLRIRIQQRVHTGCWTGLSCQKEIPHTTAFEKPQFSFVSSVTIADLAFWNASCDLIAFSSYLALTDWYMHWKQKYIKTASTVGATRNWKRCFKNLPRYLCRSFLGSCPNDFSLKALKWVPYTCFAGEGVFWALICCLICPGIFRCCMRE